MFRIFERLKWGYQKLHISSWMPFLALVAYTVFGGFVFRAIEREPDIQRREDYRNRTHFALQQMVDRMLEVKCYDPLSKNDIRLQEKHAKEAIYWFLDHLNLTVVIDENTDETPWTWIGAMFYAGQLYTTIGYGVPTTKTRGGRIATIFYILFGIPIFLIILKDMGRLLSRSLRKLYKRIRSSKRKIAQSTPLYKITFPMKVKNEKDPEKCLPPMYTGEQDKKKNRDETSFPISIALTILIFWILFSASLFCIWERQWGFVTSVYFFFVSISTVGLGDIVFSNPEMMIYNFGLILVGLALLSMCFNLIQNALERMLDRLLDEYIEEIEKMAEIVTNDDEMQEEAIPLEFKLSGNLLALPMKRVANDSGFLAEAKGWMAGRIANNLIASRLGHTADSESENDEDEAEKNEEQDKFNVATVDVVVHDARSSRRQSKVSCANSNSSFSTTYTNSMVPDDDSLMSAAFCDLKFDYATEPYSPISIHKNSSQSIYRMDDDDVMKSPTKANFNSRKPGLPPPPVPRKPAATTSPLHSVREHHVDEDREILMTPRRLASMTDIETTSQMDSGYEASRLDNN
ncbi:unnamed protein product [Caenorhabditis bovis]|uniref:Potassium channel domain-containing protein n=1 Tax=Caenorhabditis bovis TaxID=2654633 RepID=A0A8S1E7X4_9PELO|nr:unnamed protein product [Caenorhabditis bovis]